MLAEAEEQFARGEPIGALRALDAVDARMDCGRFTEGDAPPEVSLAIACVRRLKATGREVELNAVFSAAEGSILTELRGNLSGIPPEGE